MIKSHTLLCIVAIVVITVVSGVVEGTLSGRWGPSVDLVAAGQALGSFPKEIGDWEMQKEDQVDEKVLEVLRCTGSLHRVYMNRETGQVVNVALIVGPPGPPSVHVPEICYSSQAHTQEGPRQSVRLAAADGSRDGDFWSLTFRPNDVNSLPLSVFYAWSSGQRWEAAENPRMSLSGTKILYKIQLAADIRETFSPRSGTTSPCQSFLESMLAEPGLLGTSG